MKTPKRTKLFVIRKYVYARTAAEALAIQRRIAADDIWLDDDWKKAHPDEVAGEMPSTTRRRRSAPSSATVSGA